MLRAELEDAAHAALDAVDRLIAILDQINGDVDFEPADDESDLSATKQHSNNIV